MRFLLLILFPLLISADRTCKDACGSAIQVGNSLDCYCNSECLVPGTNKKCCSDFKQMCPKEYNATVRTINQSPCPATCRSPDSLVIMAPTAMRDWDKSNRSCANNCGSAMQSSKSKKVICYCDSGCLLTNDCCEDFLQQCDADPCVLCILLAPTAQSSCQGLCGQIGNGCSCETACVETNTCCSDFQSVCPAWVDKTLVSPPSALKVGSCFSQCEKKSGTCFCDYQCIANHDCCSDYQSVCGTRSSSVQIQGAGSCYKKCGGGGLDCWCDSTCEISGDCCHDYVKHCPRK